MHSSDTDLLLDVLLDVLLLLAGTLSRDSLYSRTGQLRNLPLLYAKINLVNPIQMHYAVSDVVLQQVAHV